MRRRAVRLALQALFMALLAAAAYVVWQKETASQAAAGAARSFDERARAVSRSLLEIKSAQPGYVAAGQGEDYWVARVEALAASTRTGLTALAAQPSVAQASAELETAADALEDFEQMDRRAREYVRGGQRLLASDLVFSDGIEKMDAAVAAIERARLAEKAAADSTIAARRREQLLALGGAAAGGLLIVLALVPLPGSPRPGAAAPAAPSRQEAAAPEASVRPARSSAPAPQATRTPPVVPQPAPQPPPRALAPPPPQAPKPPAPQVDLAGIAALCSDLARVLDTRALPGALERAAALLHASGVVIWIADPDGRELAPVIAHGYPQNMLSRLGTIPKDAENATAAAFRTGVVQIVKGDAISHGAIAAPLVSPTGPLGVMAAELLEDAERHDATRAAATIVAAQLSTLMGPPPARKSEAAARV